MQLVTEKLSNGNEITYKIVNGTAYHAETPDEVVKVLEHYRDNKHFSGRIRVFLGDRETGRDWMEEYATMGYIGRSTGRIQIPLMVNNTRSMGGGALLDHCIVRITVGGRDLYRHPKYSLPKLEVLDIDMHAQGRHYTAGVNADGGNVANFGSRKQAERWAAFMKGERNSK